jgi:hypothetical protein
MRVAFFQYQYFFGRDADAARFRSHADARPGPDDYHLVHGFLLVLSLKLN